MAPGAGRPGWAGLTPKLLSYMVAPEDVEICKRGDGSEWLLGRGPSDAVYKGLRGGVQDIAIKQVGPAVFRRMQAVNFCPFSGISVCPSSFRAALLQVLQVEEERCRNLNTCKLLLTGCNCMPPTHLSCHAMARLVTSRTLLFRI